MIFCYKFLYDMMLKKFTESFYLTVKFVTWSNQQTKIMTSI